MDTSGLAGLISLCQHNISKNICRWSRFHIIFDFLFMEKKGYQFLGNRC